MKYLVTREETWTWSEEFEAENEDELINLIDGYDWELPQDALFEAGVSWEVENVS